ncbi:MAG: TraM recognition domain-containing protein [Pseudomonadota bacterium]
MLLEKTWPLYLGDDAVYKFPHVISQSNRYQHTWVLGQTGTGKSTWLRQCFMQDVLAGRGGCYFDFHGTDAPWILDRIPKERIQDVTYFDPLSRDYAVGFNPLDGIAADQHDLYALELVAMLRNFFPRESWGGQLNDILTTTFHALLQLPGEQRGTLVGAVEFLTNEMYRNYVLSHCREEAIVKFWKQEYKGWSVNRRKDALASSTNKIRTFQSSPYLRNILSQQKSGLDLRRAIAKQGIVIFNINRFYLGAFHSDILASLILSRLIYEGKTRVMPTERDRVVEELCPGFHVFIDEFHYLGTLATADALSGIRSKKISFMVAHQHTDQLKPEVYRAIKGNASTKVVFRVGSDDADKLQKVVETTNPKNLSGQPDYQFYLHYKSGKGVQTARSATPQISFEETGVASSIIRYSNSMHAKPVADVEARYQHWIGSPLYGALPTRRPSPRPAGRTGQKEKKTSGQMRPVGAIMLDRIGAG